MDMDAVTPVEGFVGQARGDPQALLRIGTLDDVEIDLGHCLSQLPARAIR